MTRVSVMTNVALWTLASVLVLASAKPQVDFYGEALCPYCEKFLVETMGPLFDQGLTDYFDFTYVPYGNARELEGQVQCQHGPMECKGNIFVNCAIHLHPELKDWFPYARCVESSNATGMNTAVIKCADNSHVNLEEIRKCAAGDLGAQLQKEAAAKTSSLKPAHKYVPWVVVNGIPLEDEFDALLKFVCVTMADSERPEACYELAPSAGTAAAGVTQQGWFSEEDEGGAGVVARRR